MHTILKRQSTGVQLATSAEVLFEHLVYVWYIRESVDSLCRDGADAQYMQYLRLSGLQTGHINECVKLK